MSIECGGSVINDSHISRRGTRVAVSRAHSILFWLLSLLFSLRVLGQAVQRWFPQPLLPAFDQFQGSSLPYPVLLATQLLILGLMLRTAWCMHTGTMVPNKRRGVFFAWFGGVYLTGSLMRMGVGLAMPDAADWFRAWIPAFFHLLLATFVLMVAVFHRRASLPSRVLEGSVT